MNRVWTVVVSILFMGVVLSLATIPDVSVPNTFTAGTKAVASEMNANFDTLELYHNNLLDSLRARLKTDTIDAKYFDTVRSSYGDFTLFDTVRATYGDFTLFDTVRATYGDFTLFDTVRATYGDFTLFDTVRATYGDITLQDTLKSNVVKGDSLTYIGNDTTRFKISKAGNVGIGTTSPNVVNGNTVASNNFINLYSPNSIARITAQGTAALLELVDTGSAANTRHLQLYNSNGTSVFRSIDDASGVQADNIIVMKHNVGDVGIDTANPASKLHVAGSVRVRDTVFAGMTSIANLYVNEATTHTIANGSITATTTNIYLDTEGSAALDTLTSITAGGANIIIIHTIDADRDVLVKENTYLHLGADRLLDNITDVLVLWRISAFNQWNEFCFSNND